VELAPQVGLLQLDDDLLPLEGVIIFPGGHCIIYRPPPSMSWNELITEIICADALTGALLVEQLTPFWAAQEKR
jgi:hypothetical protein